MAPAAALPLREDFTAQGINRHIRLWSH
jgi:hypothetical protein